MTFASPSALWLLALALPIAAVHFYRGRVRRILVPTLLFWDQLVVEEERKSALHRLRKLLSLVLALLALAALTSAFAGPSLRGFTLEPRRIAIVVDTREAMRAGTRLTDARTRARELLARLGRIDEAALYDSAGLVEAPTANKERVLDALSRLPRDLAPARWQDVLTAAGPAAYVFSTEVGTPMTNLALTAAERTSSRSVRARLTNHADEPSTATVVLRDRGLDVERRTVALAPRETKILSWELDAARTDAGALLEIALAESDAFPDDDLATVVLPATGPIPVGVLGEPPPHVIANLDVLARIGVIRLVTRGAVTLCDGVEAPAEDGGFLVFRAKGEFEVEAPQIVDFSRDAPFHRHVDYGDLRILKAQVLDGRPLVLSDKGPIATWDSRQGRACIRFGFSVAAENSNLALRLAFPLLLREAIEWLAGDGRRAFPRNAVAGRTLVNTAPLTVARGEARVTHVVGASGRTASLPIEESLVRIAVARPGFVKVEVAGREEWIAVNRADDGVDLTKVAANARPEPPAPIPWWRDLPWAPVAALLVALLLFLEWLVV